MTPLEQEEYRALRATIRERGTTRVWLFAGGIAAWAALTVTMGAISAPPVATLVPLLVLASSFEGVFALHVGVERVGRYLQVHFDDEWEKTAMAFGRPAGAPAVDALFSVPYLLGALFNVLPALIASPTVQELVFIGGAHALFLVRLAAARHAAGRQRAIDLERFQQLQGDRADAAP